MRVLRLVRRGELAQDDGAFWRDAVKERYLFSVMMSKRVGGNQ